MDVLIAAITHNNVDAARAILDAGIHLDSNPYPLLQAVMTKHSLQMVTLLVERGAMIDIVNRDNANFLHYVLEMEVLLYLVDQLSDDQRMIELINAPRISSGNTPIMYHLGDNDEYVNRCNYDVAYYLLNMKIGEDIRCLGDRSYNADPNIKNVGGETPLTSCVRKRHRIEFIQLLIDAGGDIKAEGDDTPLLFHALLTQSHENIICLFENGADPNVTDYYGRNAIIYCAMYNMSHSYIDLLLSHGVELNAVDKQGLTALDYAYYTQKNYLISRGAVCGKNLRWE